VTTTSTVILQLATGRVGGSALSFEDTASLPNNFHGYIGFSFENGSDAEQYHYGGVRAVGNEDGTMLSLTQYVYHNTPDTTITVAVVPEPSSLAMLTLGAGGLTMYRRRQQQVQPQEPQTA